MDNNTILPNEVQALIDIEATNSYPILMEYYLGGSVDINVSNRKAYIAGATAWAPWKVKHDQLQQKVEYLENWKVDAIEVMGPLIKWGQEQKGLRWGAKISVEILKRLQDNQQLKERAEAYEKALNTIEQWNLPVTGKFWDEEKTRPTSYETEYGSNGARDFIRGVAYKALQFTNKTKEDQTKEEEALLGKIERRTPSVADLKLTPEQIKQREEAINWYRGGDR